MLFASRSFHQSQTSRSRSACRRTHLPAPHKPPARGASSLASRARGGGPSGCRGSRLSPCWPWGTCVVIWIEGAECRPESHADPFTISFPSPSAVFSSWLNFLKGENMVSPCSELNIFLRKVHPENSGQGSQRVRVPPSSPPGARVPVWRSECQGTGEPQCVANCHGLCKFSQTINISRKLGEFLVSKVCIYF